MPSLAAALVRWSAGERAVVGERHGGHVELGRPGREDRDPAGAVKDGVLGVDVKVDERRFWHGTPILGLAQDRSAYGQMHPCGC